MALPLHHANCGGDAHGKEDKRAPFAQAEAMHDALEAAHKIHERMAAPRGGHGFYTEADRAAFLTRLQAFLEKHIGAGAPCSTRAQERRGACHGTLRLSRRKLTP